MSNDKEHVRRSILKKTENKILYGSSHDNKGGGGHRPKSDFLNEYFSARSPVFKGTFHASSHKTRKPKKLKTSRSQKLFYFVIQPVIGPINDRMVPKKEKKMLATDKLERYLTEVFQRSKKLERHAHLIFRLAWPLDNEP